MNVSFVLAYTDPRTLPDARQWRDADQLEEASRRATGPAKSHRKRVWSWRRTRRRLRYRVSSGLRNDPHPYSRPRSKRRLAPEELFFSTTDRKGIITAENSVFSRVACYPLEVMIGRVHNIVRHPDMPRAVFQLL
jgi:hypothetical protein